jgi:hypothetical protein
MMREIKFDIINRIRGQEKLYHDYMTLEDLEATDARDDEDYEVVAGR